MSFYSENVYLFGAVIGNLFFTAILILFYMKFKKETRNLEERNKRLSALKRIYEVMMLYSTDLVEVAQKVTDAISYELGFSLGVFALIDYKSNVLRRVAMTNTNTSKTAKDFLPVPYEKLEIPLSAKNNITVRAIYEKKVLLTHDLYDIFTPAISREVSDKIQKTVGVHTSLVFPVNSRDKTVGVMIVSLTKNDGELKTYEKESINNLIDVAGIAFDNASLYKDLQLTTKELTDANIRLKELDKLKDDFVSIASHELRTPMTAIRSYVWMALNRSDIPLSEKLKKYLDRTLVSTERLINLVNDMLNISRIESGSIEISPVPFNICELINEVQDEVIIKLKEKNQNIIIGSCPSPKVFADPNKVHQVVLNLIGNSMKFTPVGGSITIEFFSDGKMLEIGVKDSGVGISKDDLSMLFKKFGRLDNSYVAAATSGGTGLGLYICKSLVELMHGRIWASSEGMGKGATFTFSLPLASQAVLAHPDLYKVSSIGEAKGLEPVAI